VAWLLGRWPPARGCPIGQNASFRQPSPCGWRLRGVRGAFGAAATGEYS
jgi:hypothetical protein